MTEIRDTLKSRYRRAVKQEPPKKAFVVDGDARAVILGLDCIPKKTAGKPGRVGECCDDLVVLDVGRGRTGIYAVERKTGSTDIAKIQRQLQGGMKFVDDVIRHERLHGQRFVFEPVWVSGQSKAVNIKVRKLANRLAGKKVSSGFADSKTIRHMFAGGRLPRLRSA